MCKMFVARNAACRGLQLTLLVVGLQAQTVCRLCLCVSLLQQRAELSQTAFTDLNKEVSYLDRIGFYR